MTDPSAVQGEPGSPPIVSSPVAGPASASPPAVPEARPAELERFWSAARTEHPSLPEQQPQAWAFGASSRKADVLLDLVLRGTKTATASSLRDYGADDEPLPQAGELSILLDGSGEPRAVIETTAVSVVPFDQVGPEHARAEGEGDRSLAHWRRVHEAFWREHGEDPRGVTPDMPVVCEEFRVVLADAPL